MGESAVAPEGWYPDPGGKHAWRWWDGVAWTGQLSPREGDTPPPEPPPPAPGLVLPQPPPVPVPQHQPQEHAGKLRRGMGKYLGLRTEEQSAGLTAYRQLLNDVVEGRAELTGLGPRLRAARDQADLADSKDWQERIAAFRAVGHRVLADDYLSEQEDAELGEALEALGFSQADLEGPLRDVSIQVMIARANAGRLEAKAPQRVMVKRGEEVYLEVPASLMKEVAMREFRGGSAGVSVPIGGGVRFRTSSMRGHMVTVGTQLQVADSGVLGVTTTARFSSGSARPRSFATTGWRGCSCTQTR